MISPARTLPVVIAAVSILACAEVREDATSVDEIWPEEPLSIVAASKTDENNICRRGFFDCSVPFL